MEREKIENMLIEIGITPNLDGFDYICEAIKELEKNSKTKITGIYEVVGLKIGRKWSQVERGIRYAITKIKKEELSEMSNSEFLHTLLLYLRR